MIKVCLYKNDYGLYGFSCEGHADYAGAGETDEVCAAVTGLAGTLVVSLTDLLGLDVNYDFQPGHLSGKISPKDLEKISADTSAKADLLFRSFALGCEQIEYSYGSEFVQVNPEPVPEKQEEDRCLN